MFTERGTGLRPQMYLPPDGSQQSQGVSNSGNMVETQSSFHTEIDTDKDVR